MKANTFSKVKIANGCLISGLLFLSACNPAPKYAKPPAQTPVSYKEAVPQEYKEATGWKLAQPGDDKIGGRWWQIYNDPQLSELEQKVQISNQTIIAAEANFRAARSLVVSARSGLFPTITAAPSYTNSRVSQTARGTSVVGSSSTGTGGANTGTGTTNTGTGSTGTGTGTGTGTTTGSGSSTTTTTSTGGTSTTGLFNNFSLPIDISYSLDLWHRIRNTVAANAFAAQASAADVGTATLTIQAELAQDYFEIRALDAQRKLLEETLAAYTEALNLARVRYQGGIASEEDVVEAQTQVNTATAQSTDVTVARATFEHAIATLIGRPASTFSLPASAFTPNPPPVPVALPSELLERRPDIAAAERRVAAANAEIGVARAAYYPNLNLSAAAGFQTSQFTEWFTWPSRFWSLGPQFAETLLDFGARRAVNEQAQANYDQTVANYRQSVLTAFQAVEDNLSTLRILSTEIGQEQTAVNSANRFLTLSLIRYRGGVDSFLTVITAQTAVLTTRETELQIQLRQMSASVGLILALGGGWDPASLPQMKDLAAKRPRPASSSDNPASPLMPVAAPNPPPLPADMPVPGAPDTPPQVPVSVPQVVNPPAFGGR